MPTFIDDETYTRLLIDLREAARAGDWESALAEVLCGVNVLPAACRGDFVDQL
ncbi:hypothetical protein [Rhodobacter capsulatus]|uniref:hypothetical protein n=1 Tax=Rhodobacter capsulatus TaxID=1061 RepID=UPI004024AF9C